MTDRYKVLEEFEYDNSGLDSYSPILKNFINIVLSGNFEALKDFSNYLDIKDFMDVQSINVSASLLNQLNSSSEHITQLKTIFLICIGLANLNGNVLFTPEINYPVLTDISLLMELNSQLKELSSVDYENDIYNLSRISTNIARIIYIVLKRSGSLS